MYNSSVRFIVCQKYSTVYIEACLYGAVTTPAQEKIQSCLEPLKYALTFTATLIVSATV